MHTLYNRWMINKCYPYVHIFWTAAFRFHIILFWEKCPLAIKNGNGPPPFINILPSQSSIYRGHSNATAGYTEYVYLCFVFSSLCSKHHFCHYVYPRLVFLQSQRFHVFVSATTLMVAENPKKIRKILKYSDIYWQSTCKNSCQNLWIYMVKW